MNVFEILQLIGGIVLTISSIPQYIKLYKRKSSKDISLTWIVTCLIGISLMEPYAIYLLIEKGSTAFTITNSIAILTQAILLTMVLKYK